jgi:hypothetical protein
MTAAGRVARKENTKILHKFMTGKSEENRLLGRLIRK